MIDILIPRRLEDRKIKQKQNNLRLLQKEIIDGDLTIDEYFDFKKDQVKVKLINGNVILKDLDHIPEWLKDVEINGRFNCSVLGLTSLDNCPNATTLYCSNNKLTSLKLNDKLTGLYCSNNKLTSIICNDKLTILSCDNNKLTSLTLGKELTELSCHYNKLPLNNYDGMTIKEIIKYLNKK